MTMTQPGDNSRGCGCALLVAIVVLSAIFGKSDKWETYVGGLVWKALPFVILFYVIWWIVVAVRGKNGKGKT